MKQKNLAFFIICLATAFALISCTGRVELMQGVTESEANEALAALLESGITASKLPGKEGTVGIEVGSADVARAISILKSEGLPRERYAKMGEVFKKEGLISSPLEERARYLWALSQELSATISQIDGVIKARVHVVLPERGAAGDPSLPSSAAVFIKHKAGINIDESVAQVKRLVANSITGLSADKVTVILLPSGQKLHHEPAVTQQDTTQKILNSASENVIVDSPQQSQQKSWYSHVLAMPVWLLSMVGALLSLIIFSVWLFPRITKLVSSLRIKYIKKAAQSVEKSSDE
ncbi:MAG: hypothetical protein RLZ92_1879 [Pseudomonadota bacterium]